MLVASARHLVPLTDLDPLDAAPLTDAGLTPYHAIKRSLSLLVPGSHVVVIGAGGGLGHLAVQILAALAPSRIIAVDQRESGLALAQGLGADAGVLSGDDTVQEIRELTHGRGAELVLDFVGVGVTMSTALAVSRTLGHVTIVGVAGGTVPYSFFSTPFDVLLGNTYWGTIPELFEVVALAERGRIRAQVQRLSLDEAPQGYDALAAGTIEGRAVVVPGG
jgi:propanol-preferring alcohol dehydrogenase